MSDKQPAPQTDSGLWSVGRSRPGRPRLSPDLEPLVDQASAAVLLQQPRQSRLLLWLIGLFMTLALLWAYWAELDEVTRGQGRVIPSQQVQVVQNLEGGILKEVFIREGDRVSRGQPLLRIDDTRFRSDFREREQELAFLQASISRHRAELDSVTITEEQRRGSWRDAVRIERAPLQIDAAWATTHAELLGRVQAQLDANLSDLINQLAIADRQIEQREQERRELESTIRHLSTAHQLSLDEFRMTQPLAERGIVSRVELLKLEREVNRIEQELASSRLLLPKIRSAQQEELYKRRDVALKFRTEAQRQLNEAVARLAQLNEGQVNLQDRVDRTSVVSPVDGTVKTIAINTVGGIIQPGMDLVEIVPTEDNLLIEARILPKDIAFLRPGLKAVLRFTAYDFAVYGGLQGKLEHISADSIEDEKGDRYYLIRIRAEKNYLGQADKALPIIPGMLATVDIVTGKKSVLDYLLKPVLRAQNYALRER